MENPTVFIAFVAGFLSFVSPCVLPLVPAYIGYLSARATAREAPAAVAVPAGPGQSVPVTGINRLAIFMHGVAFVSGFTIVFVLFGMITNFVIANVAISSSDIKNSIAQVGGVLVILFGLHVLGLTAWVLRLLINHVRWEGGGLKIKAGLERLNGLMFVDTRRQMNPRNPYGYLGSMGMGVIFAAGWSPCIGPILGMILTLAASATTGAAWLNGGFLLLAYSIGLGVPFLIAALAINRVRSATRSFQKRIAVVDRVVRIPFVLVYKALSFLVMMLFMVPLKKARAAVAAMSGPQINTVELLSGAFMILVGYLLLSGELSRLSQAGGSFATFTYNLEGCSVGLLRGEVPLGDFNTCMTLGINYKERLAGPQGGTGTEGNAGLPSGTPTVQPSITPEPLATIAVGINTEQRAPDFTVSTLDGQKITLSDLKGKVVLLNFWATWCDPCKAEMPIFQTVGEKYQKDGLVILAVDNHEDTATVSDYIKQSNLKLTIGLDSSGAISRQYNAVGMPLSYIIGRDGVIHVKQAGPFSLTSLEAALKGYLGN